MCKYPYDFAVRKWHKLRTEGRLFSVIKRRIIKNSYHVNLMYYNILLSLKEFASFIQILWLRV